MCKSALMVLCMRAFMHNVHSERLSM